VTIFARMPSSPLEPQSAPARVRTLAMALGAIAAVLTMMISAAPAHAIVAEVGGVKVGLQPRSIELGAELPETETFANESGNVVLHGTGDYLIYWDPNKQLKHEWIVNLDTFFHALGALGEAGLATPFSAIGQYHDRSNVNSPFQASFKGSYSDTVKFPTGECTDPQNPAATCLTDAQLRTQLQSFIATHNLPTGMGTVYYLLTPPGTTVCLDQAATRCSDYVLTKTELEKGERKSTSYKESFCSYHADINPDSAAEGDGRTVLYAAIPWTAYTDAYDCQDGGWSPEEHKETYETPQTLSEPEEKAREKALGEMPTKQKEAAEKRRRLEGPHIEEPNQEGKDEEGDYAAGLTDLLVNQISEEEMNIITDPLLGSWQNASGAEVTDLCRNAFASTAGSGGGAIGGSVTASPFTEAGSLSNVTVGPKSYYINNTFNLAQLNSEDEDPCVGGVGLLARFTEPDPVKSGEIVGVDGMESTVGMIRGETFGPTGPPTTTYATFSWNFGDGTPEVKGFAPGAPQCEAPWLSPCAASAFHTYQYGGKYEITLTITDVAGNTTSVSHEVEVSGPLAPRGQGALVSSPASTSTSTGTPGAAAGSAAGHASVPAPVAAAAIPRQTLHSAVQKGLVVSYSVNEQVAGHFEVLLSSATAHRLHISGAPAVGLPKGSPAEVVIAKAILVTTKGGHSAVHIAFSKLTAARLAHVHKVSLMLRLIVRNAASVDPLTTSVVSSATLSA
jgi:PKD domain